MEEVSVVRLPRHYKINVKVNGKNRLQQLSNLYEIDKATIQIERVGKKNLECFESDGFKVYCSNQKTPIPEGCLLLTTTSGHFPASSSDIESLSAKWINPEVIKSPDALIGLREEVRQSWENKFKFVEESYQNNQFTNGLRHPQIGALYAVLAHWKTSQDVATVVMPTGTGKTETMLCIAVHQRLPRLLVVVPNDALRSQIADKFLTLGLIKKLGVLPKECKLPIVCTLASELKDMSQVDSLFSEANVIVSTMNILNGCSDEAKKRIVELCSHMFIDEAHHVPAKTWKSWCHKFQDKPIIQFTATPFRRDRKHIPGKVIFNYPLRKAQEEKYFTPIVFDPVSSIDTEVADRLIAEKAIKYLNEDLASGFDHLVMARADEVSRAATLNNLYNTLGHPAVLMHSGLKAKEKQNNLEMINSRKARIVVCVDMFGEGFDLPELKIAAMHDVHKSLAITLQFTGRFTRSRTDLGTAKLIANIDFPEVQNALQDLYAEDTDWNLLIRTLSETASEKEERRSEFYESFQGDNKTISVQTVAPKMSTVVYKTYCENWNLSKFKELPRYNPCDEPLVSEKDKILIFVVKNNDFVDWGNLLNVIDTKWDLYIIYWDHDNQFAYIHSSSNDGVYEDLAKSVFGSTVEQIKGEQVFRCLGGIKRLTLTNLGLSQTINKAVRFTMFMGSDIIQGLSTATRENRIKSNIFGFGYENEEKASAGCSSKGRIWSYKIASDTLEWVSWCKTIGEKLRDNTINVDKILELAIKWEAVKKRPEAIPIAIEWPETFFDRSEESIKFIFGEDECCLSDVSVDIIDPSENGPIKFKIFSETRTAQYQMDFLDDKIQLKKLSGANISIKIGKKSSMVASEYFNREPLWIYFHNRMILWGNLLAKPTEAKEPYKIERLSDWDWTGTLLNKESQGYNKDTESIQYRVISYLKEKDYQIIFDDDNPGEAADVVAIKILDSEIEFHLYHCKYVHGGAPRSQVADLYEVCGQAQKSVRWREKPDKLLRHLADREKSRLKKRPSNSRFEVGTIERLREIERKARFLRPKFKVYIVQPGISKGNISIEQLELLAATELYLQETFGISLEVITSP